MCTTLEVTAFILRNEGRMEQFSSSIAESGLQNIGQVTWRNACAAMEQKTAWLCHDLAALREHFAEYGAWEADELAAMSGTELNALLVQFIAGEYQEHEADVDRVLEWGRLMQSDDGTWSYEIGV